jgi:hypothetical protein
MTTNIEAYGLARQLVTTVLAAESEEASRIAAEAAGDPTTAALVIEHLGYIVAQVVSEWADHDDPQEKWRALISRWADPQGPDSGEDAARA